MALLNKRSYVKKEPFRDAIILIIICEGEKREPDYFEFFNELTSQLKVIPVASKEGESAPNHLLSNANDAIEKHNSDNGDYELWFVLDVDRWRKHIHILQAETSTKNEWNIAISNPCFEVWLYNHFTDKLPDFKVINSCSDWKQLIPKIRKGGFDSTKHPTLLGDAIVNSKKNYKEEGYIPEVGRTQLFRLGEKIFDKTKKILEKYN